jgi:hypothetical protein
MHVRRVVCAHSIRSRASERVEIEFMRLTRDPSSPWYSFAEKGEGWETSTWVTPFSRLRWATPAVCGFEGRAICCDNDMRRLADIGELWYTLIQPGKVVVAKNAKRFCVALFDCTAAPPWLPPLKEMQRGADIELRHHPELVQEFAPENWNCLDGEDLPLDQIKCLHFTTIASQPALPHAIARMGSHWFNDVVTSHCRPELTAAWEAEIAVAKATGYRVEDYIQQEHFGPLPKRSLEGYQGLRPQ